MFSSILFIINSFRERGLSLAVARLGSPQVLAEALVNLDFEVLTSNLVDKMVDGKLYPVSVDLKDVDVHDTITIS